MLVLVLLLFVSSLGCSKSSDTGDSKDSRDSESKQTKKIKVRSAATDRKPDAAELLDLVIEKYKSATAYSDAGEVTLRYRADGRLFVDSAPYQVHFQRGKRLGLDVYQTRVDVTATRFRAKIEGDGVPELRGQFVDRAIQEGLTWDELTSDQALHESLAQGLGRYPLVLELLMAPEPLALFRNQDQFARRLLDNEEIDGKECYGLRIETESGPFDLWIDATSLVVRRVVFPVDDSAAKMEAESGAQEIRVVAELRDARFSKNPSESDLPAPEARKNDQLVQRFVVPPDPLPTNLLGKSMPAFRLSFLDGQPFEFGPERKNAAVFHWFVDHPACEASLKLFDDVATRFADSEQIEFYAVCPATDDTPIGEIEALVERWGVSVTILRDSDAIGRDVFQIPALPAIIALGADSRLQIYEITFIPKLDELLAEAVQKLLDGDDLASEVLSRFEEAQRAYTDLLESGGQ
jgi:hypothetical protein